MMYDTIESLPQDIKDDESFREAVNPKVVWPGRSLWGVKDEALITIEYQCSDAHTPTAPHWHELLYGPRVLHFHDECRWCGKHKWAHGRITDHEYEALGESEYDYSRWELYAS